MSNKSHRLQKKAAELFVLGYSDYEIIKECGIREYTLKRWKFADVFTSEVQRLRAAWLHQRPLRMQRLVEGYIDALSRALAEEKLDPKKLAMMHEIAQYLEKDQFFLCRGGRPDPIYAPYVARNVRDDAETLPDED